MAKCDTTGSRGGGRCPICEAPTQHRVRPFCSKRCQDVDLGRWLRGNYRVPTEEVPGEEPAEDDGDDSLYSGRA